RWDCVRTQKRHHFAERRACHTIGGELALVELLDWGHGRDRFQAIFVVAAGQYPYQLNQEWIELELMVAAIRTNQ
ncbi:MAG: hypothetical protein WD005_01585, partial [Haliea sp.]